MTSELNPYASPPTTPNSANVTNATLVDADLSACPELPLTFRVPTSTLLIMAPLGMIAGMVSMASILHVFWPQPSTYNGANAIAAILVAMLTGATSYGCLIAFRSRMTIGHAGFEIVDMGRRPIYFVYIKSWHHHPATGTVYVTLSDSDEYLPVSNWAMSKANCMILGDVLRAKVGPPSG